VNPSELFQLEHGVCVKCGLDCHKLVQHIQPLTLDDHTTCILQTAPQFDRHKCLYTVFYLSSVTISVHIISMTLKVHGPTVHLMGHDIGG